MDDLLILKSNWHTIISLKFVISTQEKSHTEHNISCSIYKNYKCYSISENHINHLSLCELHALLAVCDFSFVEMTKKN